MRENLGTGQAIPEINNKHLDWKTDLKINLVIMDEEERVKERGFM